ncbi:MAG: trypsin-like peptidase domain-containing protein [Clostridiales bacterium]|nr:trypsin-like peptidase domain-containing protein [Clostridiales bacterium]
MSYNEYDYMRLNPEDQGGHEGESQEGQEDPGILGYPCEGPIAAQSDSREETSAAEPDVYQDAAPLREEQRVSLQRSPAKRSGTKTVAAILCCLFLMLGSGLAGAKISENYYNALPGNAESAYSSNSEADVMGTVDSGSIQRTGGVNPGGQSLSLTELFAGANPAVVAISTETTGRNVFGRTVTLPAAGSGFIISEDGYIVTNNHVIENAGSITVLLYDGTKYPAVLVGRDPESDLAVLRIEARDLQYLSWGDSAAMLVGEQVVAIGNPLGEFANSMTVGYISALDREINIDGVPRNMLQTDAAVNEGNSGGPLLNLKGQVIGIVSAKSSGMNVEGLGFAIPSGKAKSIVEQLIRDGYVKGRAVMGVTVSTQAAESGQFVYVESVNPGSAADKAGMAAGDIILAAKGTAVESVEGLKEIINNLSPGDELALELRRGEQEMRLTLTLDEYKPSDEVQPMPNMNQRQYQPYQPDQEYGMPFDPRGMYPGGGMPQQP